MTVRVTCLMVILAIIRASGSFSEAPVQRGTFTLKTWGMPGEPRFLVVLAASDEVSVIRDAFPITKGGLTKSTYFRKLTSSEAESLFEAARAATDFSEGCGKVADGTNAELVIATGGEEVERECHHAGNWPVGERTKTFLSTVNQHFPKDLQVY